MELAVYKLELGIEVLCTEELDIQAVRKLEQVLCKMVEPGTLVVYKPELYNWVDMDLQVLCKLGWSTLVCIPKVYTQVQNRLEQYRLELCRLELDKMV